jgi:hypothetical protein
VLLWTNERLGEGDMRDTSAHKRTLRLTEEGGDEEMMVEVRGSYFHIWSLQSPILGYL